MRLPVVSGGDMGTLFLVATIRSVGNSYTIKHLRNLTKSAYYLDNIPASTNHKYIMCSNFVYYDLRSDEMTR